MAAIMLDNEEADQETTGGHGQGERQPIADIKAEIHRDDQSEEWYRCRDDLAYSTPGYRRLVSLAMRREVLDLIFKQSRLPVSLWSFLFGKPQIGSGRDRAGPFGQRLFCRSSYWQ